MKTILVATDFSERSDRAIRRATLIARQFGAAVSLVHVIDDDRPRHMLEAESDLAAVLLDEQARTVSEIDGIACDSRVVCGAPFAGIAQAADDIAADLLVIGPHRRQALKDVFVGTTAERTIRASCRPVLMASGVPAGPWRHALVAVDFSKGSADAVKALQHLGGEDRMNLSVVHVLDAQETNPMRRAAIPREQIVAHLAEEEARAARDLAAFVKDLGVDPVAQLVRRQTTATADDICAAAREVSADVIIVGTHGRSGLARFFLGSVAEAVLQASDRDVLAVPAPCAD